VIRRQAASSITLSTIVFLSHAGVLRGRGWYTRYGPSEYR
jgi:hypothetical protein